MRIIARIRSRSIWPKTPRILKSLFRTNATLSSIPAGGWCGHCRIIGDDPFLCVNADNWWTDEGENAFKRLMASVGRGRMDVLMLVVPLDGRTIRKGRAISTWTLRAACPAASRDAQGAFVWTGIQMLAKRLIVDPPSDVFSTNIFWDRAIAEGRCFGLVHEGLWFDVGYPAAIAATEQKLAEHANS